MAPLTTEPDALRVVLNPARRRAYYNLVKEIIGYMRSQIELPHDSPLSSPTSSHVRSPPAYSETSPSPALIRLRRAALLHFDSWRDETLGKLREVLSKPDDQGVVDARRKRGDRLRDVPRDGEDLLSFGDENGSNNNNSNNSNSYSSTPALPPRTPSTTTTTTTGPTALPTFQHLYHPLPTRLSTTPPADRKETLSATLLLLLSAGSYSAYSRTLICHICSALELPPAFLDAEETEVATTMIETARKAAAAEAFAGAARGEGGSGSNGGSSSGGGSKNTPTPHPLTPSRLWKVGLASVAGAALIGVTGGLAAPAVAGVIGGLMGTVGLGGLASFLGIFWMNGALVGTLFGAFGARMTGRMVDRYAKEVEDFRFVPLGEEWGRGFVRGGDGDGDGDRGEGGNGGGEGGDGSGSGSGSGSARSRRLRVTIGINGWLATESDVTKPWRALGDETEAFALRYEMKSLLALGAQLHGFVAATAWSAVRAEILQRTVLATLQGALWPLFLLSSAASLDNPFSLARNRSEKAGKILADALIDRVQGERPVTLIGYSLGARVVYSCLRVLAERKAFGLVDTAVLIGAPVPSSAAHWAMMRTVVSGRLFNVYSENDYILGFLYRATSMQLGIAGLQPIAGDVGIENVDLSNEVTGHLRYPGLTAKILARCGFPDVKGGAGAIEKDDGKIEIELRDRDWAESGNLIDVEDDDKKKPPQPSRHRLRDMQNEKFDPSVKNVLEQKSDVKVRDAKLGGARDVKEHDGQLTMTTSMPNLDSRTSPKTEAATAPSRSASTSNMEVPPPPAYSVFAATSHGNDDNDDDYAYDSEEGGGGITMINNDSDGEELTFVEPIRIEDD